MRSNHTGRRHTSIALHYRAGLALAFLLTALMAAGWAHAQGILQVENTPPLSTLIKFDDREYEIAYSQEISLDPISSSIVRKIGYGNVTDVRIATTPSGTYSTDGFTSPHIQYPGVTVTEVFGNDGHRFDGRKSGPGYSIFSFGPNPRGGYSFSNVNERGVRSCMTQGSIVSCYRTY